MTPADCLPSPCATALVGMLLVAVPAITMAQPAAAPPAAAAAVTGAGPLTGEAPIVAGNAATAKQRALDDAFRQAVERSFTALAAEGGGEGGTVPQLRASLFARARRYVRGYRVVGEGEEGGRYRVQVEADVDEGLLRRDIDRARGSSSPLPARAATGLAVLITGSPAEAVAAVARALGAAGLRAETPPLGPLDEARARELAGRAGAAGVALVSASVNPEGPVRGTGKRSAACQLAVRVLPASGNPAADRGTDTRAFADGDAAAGSECLARAAGDLAAQVTASLSGGGSAPPGMRLVILDVDLVEPAALPLVLQALRKTGNAVEVRRVTVGHIELRASTRLPPPALVAAMTREIGAAATVTPGTALADRMALQVRLAATELAPSP
jgi:hypothetical protein